MYCILCFNLPFICFVFYIPYVLVSITFFIVFCILHLEFCIGYCDFSLCVLFILYSAFYIAHSIFLPLHQRLCISLSIVHAAHLKCAVFIVHFQFFLLCYSLRRLLCHFLIMPGSFCIVHCSLYIFGRFTLDCLLTICTLYIVHNTLCIMYYALWILNYAICIMYSSLWIWHCSFCIEHCVSCSDF